nr:hypothetical protein [Deltaproteobacteria bacterium]
MTTLTSIAAAAASLVCAAALTASAQSQADIASKLNDEGKALMHAGNAAEASVKFRDAAARVPEPKYFFNLCTANYQQGKFDEAITACNAADKHSPSAELAGKIAKLVERIKADAAEQKIELHPTGGGGGDQNLPPDPNTPPDPNRPPDANPEMNPTYTPAVGRPPQQGLFTGTSADNHYTWTLGLDLYGGGGQVGDGRYGNVAGGFRLKGDYLLSRAARLGAQIYLQYSAFAPGEDQLGAAASLSVIDFGVAAYKHFCLPSYERLCMTPLAGIQLALMAPGDDQNSTGETVFNYSAIGGRVELGAHYAIGRRFEHVIGVGVGINVYSAVISDSEDLMASDVGLDKGGAAAYLS